MHRMRSRQVSSRTINPSAVSWLVAVLPFAAMLAALAAIPLSLPMLNHRAGKSGQNQSYLPSLEYRRARRSFYSDPVGELRYADPQWVFIGDSMLGTRIHPMLFGEIAGDGTRIASFLFQAASGPAWWYLAFKNYLVASGVTPRLTFFFFRDTNMTDTMFRLEGHLGGALDEVAGQREPELDALVAQRRLGFWWRVDATLNHFYEVDDARAWMHPAVRRWFALYKNPDPSAVANFEASIERNFNENFRRDLKADLPATGDEADFHRDLPTSVLPLIMQLSKDHTLPVCFVRVQRRPVGNRPPPQSPALLAYVADFKHWATAQGACFHDDTGDPELTIDLYEDGDHFADRIAYTKIFRRRLDALLR